MQRGLERCRQTQLQCCFLGQKRDLTQMIFQYQQILENKQVLQQIFCSVFVRVALKFLFDCKICIEIYFFSVSQKNLLYDWALIDTWLSLKGGCEQTMQCQFDACIVGSNSGIIEVLYYEGLWMWRW
eukprot:TRINITY_DN3005_c0_g2_i2.p5 TRINITY_DN3005_c0_g2~~TRINITY_DN3005_c0_g2_i2.p5  ORF type:complete len:127 (+),score=8.36 TRINITY_DN3005_c0_g2_i2:652-1032(+)